MENARINQFIMRSGIGVIVGVVVMLLGGQLAQLGPEFVLSGVALSLGGWALMLWGCINYMRWKGYSGWFGLIGYLLLLGLIILLCLPNRRKRSRQMCQSGVGDKSGEASEEDQKAGYQFLLGLVPLGVFFMLLAGFVLRARSNVDASEWKQVAPPGIGFRALMPGTPLLKQQTQETPAGKVDVYKFTVKTKGRKGIFMIVLVRFPEEVVRQIGGVEKLLGVGRKDVLAASKGRVGGEKRVVLDGCPGLELELLPSDGAAITVRIFATKNRLYEVSVYASKFRLKSEDVSRFFDSFKLLTETSAAE